VLAATVLGSGVAFLDSTVVNVALPTIGADLHIGVSGLQWTLDAYLVTLTSLLLFGGSLGDVLGRRRVFVLGLLGFLVASVACGLAPNSGALIAARGLQGATAAFVVPLSLAIVSATFHADDRGAAVGAWSGLAGVTSALGPLLGGWLIDAVSWRLIFFINVPLIAIAVLVAIVHVPETKDEHSGRPDWAGASAISIGLAALTYALIEQQWIVGVGGIAALLVFVVIERRAGRPMLPLELFRNSQFTGANLVTFAVYAALGGAFFLLVLQLQLSLGYSALEAGTSLLPVTLLMLLLSSRAGGLAQRIGPRIPMTVGPVIVAVGLLLFGRIQPGASYLAAVLPAVAVFGAGLTLTVAPLTAAVLAAADDEHIGAASGVNNAVGRLAGLLAVAVLPAVAGLDTADVSSLSDAFRTSMQICAGLCAAGGAIAWLTVRKGADVRPVTQASLAHPCGDPCLEQGRDAA
jgi:EmrB/QacA subfamily drug resistance transporter